MLSTMLGTDCDSVARGWCAHCMMKVSESDEHQAAGNA